MKLDNMLGRIKCYGSTTVGPRGQVVIPANARKELEIESGDTILVFSGMGKHPGLLLLKAGTFEEMLTMMNEGLARFEKMVKENQNETSLLDNEE